MGSVAVVKEILGERGSGRTQEMLVLWAGHLSSRPSWVLLTELQRSPQFAEPYALYLERGARVLVPLSQAVL